MKNTRVPVQGPSYFPYDMVGKVGDDPIYPLNRNNTVLPNLNSNSNLLNSNSNFNSNPNLNSNLRNYNSNSYGSVDKNTPPSATGIIPEENEEDNKKFKRVSKCMGILIILLSALICLAALANTLISALYLAPNSWKCLASDKNSYSNFFGPKTASMRLLTWVWISVGAWASIPPLVAGVALFRSGLSSRTSENDSFNPGMPVELKNSQKNNTNSPDIYRVFAVLSMVFSLPMAFLLGIIDIILSSYCSTSGDNPIKFYLPIIVVVLAVLTFVVVLVSWYKAKDASDTEYHYIGSTYTVYETWEPTLTASKAPIETAIVPVAAPVSNHCCKSGESNPIYIVNQPTNPQPMPVNVMVPPQPMPMIPMVPMPQPRMLPQRLPPMQRPILRRAPMRRLPEIRRPPSRFMSLNQGRGIMNKPNSYQGMYLPQPTRPINQPQINLPPSNANQPRANLPLFGKAPTNLSFSPFSNPFFNFSNPLNGLRRN